MKQIKNGDLYTVAGNEGVWVVIDASNQKIVEVMTLGLAGANRASWEPAAAVKYVFLGNISDDVDWSKYIPSK